MRASDHGAGPCDQTRKPADQRGIGGAGTQHRQVRRRPLVELHEFVDLCTAEPVAASDQLLETIPAVAVSKHERVDVHRAKTSPPGSVRCMSEVVTGDAVVLDVRVAQLPVRAVSALIDIVVILIGYLVSLTVWAGRRVGGLRRRRRCGCFLTRRTSSTR